LWVVRRCPNLVGIFAGVQPIGLVPLVRQALPSRLIAMDGEGARIVVGPVKQIFAGNVNGWCGSDATVGFCRLARAVSARPVAGIDFGNALAKFLSLATPGPTAARHNVEILLRGMRPRVLDIRRQCHGAAFSRVWHPPTFMPIKRELAADARIEDCFAFGGLFPRDGLGESAGRDRQRWRAAVASMRRSIIWALLPLACSAE